MSHETKIRCWYQGATESPMKGTDGRYFVISRTELDRAVDLMRGPTLPDFPDFDSMLVVDGNPRLVDLRDAHNNLVEAVRELVRKTS